MVGFGHHRLSQHRQFLIIGYLLAVLMTIILVCNRQRKREIGDTATLPHDDQLILNDVDAGNNSRELNNPTMHDVQNPHSFEFLENPSHRCLNSPFIVIITPSRPQNPEGRRVIRSMRKHVEVISERAIVQLFIMGTSGKTSLEDLRNESRLHNDIILVDFIDTYKNLSLKTLMLLKWVNNYCQQTKYILKADDDVYVNLPNLVRLLVSAPTEGYVVGNVHSFSPPIRSKWSKNYVSVEDWPEKLYPPFPFGFAYAFSVDIAARVYQTALSIKLFPMEDVYIGIILKQIDVKPVKNKMFVEFPDIFTEKSFFCPNETIVMHMHGSRSLTHYYKELSSQTGECIRGQVLRKMRKTRLNRFIS
ncbi:beta-1,3-galactosyltransferase 1-like [Saccoglossus kowalevskii]|uniref:Hexosyltransferase n=1 Tax=Saccoglossus kowalevskii TaxID=10224 RepID=A0ABM0H1L8_SACKO|nr:PREDICTED: beta-1,3-galactosyltransferase 1-like [Saccoglossus kowalevskii]